MVEIKDKNESGKTEQLKDGTEAYAFDFTFRDEIASEAGGENIKQCFACGTCAAVCPVTGVDENFNCRRIIRQILFGLRREVLSSPIIWFCLTCARCYVHCPQKVDFPDIMRILRHMAIKGKYVPSNVIKKVREADDLAQNVRHDFIKYTFDQKQEILDHIKEVIGAKLK